MPRALLIVLALAGCVSDDDSGAAFGHVDFIRFYETGLFHQRFVDLAFQAGEVAVDQLATSTVAAPRLGPGANSLMPGIDADVAPYPHLVGPPHLHPVTGAEDKRYWAQFAGGAWSSLNVEVSPTAQYRASSSLPSQRPKVVFMWCPRTRPCMEWLTAVGRREVRCFRYGLQGQEVAVGRSSCARYHPRMFWRILTCDECPIPAAQSSSWE